jgi:hypothetical protein
MQAAHHVFHRTRMVVLQEFIGNAQIGEQVFTVGFHEKAAMITENFGHDDFDFAQVDAFERKRHG